jgi:hypothetical protein
VLSALRWLLRERFDLLAAWIVPQRWRVLEAYMDSVDIEFPAHKPDDWCFHWHKPMHIEGGQTWHQQN